jgi:hypothetical protein
MVVDIDGGLIGSGAVDGIGEGQRVSTPSVSVHAKRFWVGENERCVIVAVEEDVCLYRILLNNLR